MKIEVNSDASVEVSSRLVRFVTAEAERALARFAAQVTRVEVHLSDVNSRRAGAADKRCVVEARPAGLRPVGVTANASTLDAAVVAALGKMKRLLTAAFGRLGRTATGARKTAPKTAARKTAPGSRGSTRKGIQARRKLSRPR